MPSKKVFPISSERVISVMIAGQWQHVMGSSFHTAQVRLEGSPESTDPDTWEHGFGFLDPDNELIVGPIATIQALRISRV
jgi:hypothetical protein